MPSVVTRGSPGTEQARSSHLLEFMTGACTIVVGIRGSFASTVRGRRAGVQRSSIGTDEADGGEMPAHGGHCG